VDVYVSPTGNDANPGTLGQPMLTPQGAVSRARAYSAMSGTTIGLLAGTYQPASGAYEPITLRPTDSGVSFVSLDGPGEAKIRTSRVLTGWTQEAGDVYKVALSGVGTPFYTLYENGVRARMCRTPKLVIDPDFPMALATYLSTEGVLDSYTLAQYGVGDLDPTTWNLATAQWCGWPGGSFTFFMDTIPIASVNTGTRRMTMSQQSRYILYRDIGSRYFIQGAQLADLTEPGEFYYNGSTLYYWARDGATPNDVTIEVPTAYDVFRLVGDSATSRVQGVTFDGLEIGQTDMLRWSRHSHVQDGDGFSDRARGPADFLASTPPYDRQYTLVQAQHGVIYLENADNCLMTNLHIKNAGTNGIYGREYNQTHEVSDSWLEQIGNHGVYVDGMYPGMGDVSRDWTFDDLKINAIGQLCGQGNGISILNSGHHTITRCEIFDGIHCAILIGAYIDLLTTNCYAQGCVTSYTKMYDLCQDTGDGGGYNVYGNGGRSGGPYGTNTLNQATIDNVWAHPSMPDIVPDGLYFDQDSWGQVLTNIEVTNVQGDERRNNQVLGVPVSGEHTETNCSWNGGFNPALMDYANIGLRPTFPSFAA
jgi:hypothetical protein